jgi:heptosyltransferase-1
MPSAMPLNVLIVKLSSLGDVIQTIPVVGDILLHYPNAQIDWVVEEAFAPLLNQVAGVRRVIPIAHRRWRRMGVTQWFDEAIRAEKKQFAKALTQTAYDAVIDAQGLIKSGLITRRARLTTDKHVELDNIKKQAFRATFANRSQACGYEWPVRLCTNLHIPIPTKIHAVQRTRTLCAGALGFDSEDITPPIYTWKPAFNERLPLELFDINGSLISTEQPYVILIHGSSRSDNAWPLNQWTALANALCQQGFNVVLTQSTEAESNAAREISDAANAGLSSIHGRTWALKRADLLAIVHCIHQSAAVIGLDTGLSHLAVALNKPCVHIFLHDRAWRAGPMDDAVLGKPHQVHVGQSITTHFDDVWRSWQTVMPFVASARETALARAQDLTRPYTGATG